MLIYDSHLTKYKIFVENSVEDGKIITIVRKEDGASTSLRGEAAKSFHRTLFDKDWSIASVDAECAGCFD